MPEFLTRRIGPLPTWSYMVLGAIAFVWVRSRQAQSSAQVAPLNVNPDYGTAGFAGQGALSPDSLLPISAASTTAFQPPANSGGSSSANAPYGTDPYGNPYAAPGGAGNPVNRVAASFAANPPSSGSGPPRLPR